MKATAMLAKNKMWLVTILIKGSAVLFLLWLALDSRFQLEWVYERLINLRMCRLKMGEIIIGVIISIIDYFKSIIMPAMILSLSSFLCNFIQDKKATYSMPLFRHGLVAALPLLFATQVIWILTNGHAHDMRVVAFQVERFLFSLIETVLVIQMLRSIERIKAQ